MSPIMRALFNGVSRGIRQPIRVGALVAAAFQSGGGDVALNIKSAIKLTNSSGIVSWTFATPFAPGVVPVMSIDIIELSNQPFSPQLISVNNTGVSYQILRSAGVSVSLIGLTVLTQLVAVGANVAVNMIAMEPTDP